MARMDFSRDALIEAPEEFGLRMIYPQPRTDAPQRPVQVLEVVDGYPDQLMTYSRVNLGGNEELTPSDIIWHQESNTLALVTSRIGHDQVMARGVVFPTTEEEFEAFQKSGGKGHWVCVFQGWLLDWELPSEMVNLVELIDMATVGDDIADLMPGTRASGRQPWGQTGQVDPDKMLTPKTSSFLKKQREMMQLLATEQKIEDEEHFELPTPEEVKDAGGLIDTFVPIEPPKPEGKIISYEKQEKRSKAPDS